MITWKFDLEKQGQYYETFKNQLKVNKTWQELKYYVLPIMPEKFRGRVIFLPKTCEPKKLYSIHKLRLKKLEQEWNKKQKVFEEKIISYFPKLNSINIVISPSFYGSVGWYGFWDNNKTILVRPRYDRRLIDVQKLVVNSLTHFFYISKKVSLDTKTWLKKQKKAKELQNKIFEENSKSKNMTDILSEQFAGNLAQDSIVYLKELGIFKPSKIKILKKFTNTENKIFNLLLNNKERLVSFDQIAKVIWEENYFDKYSEYAITKHIENIKKKISKNHIHNQRGYGYILV